VTTTEIDRSDPAVRAELALRDAEQEHRGRRTLVGLVLAAVAVAGPFVAAPLTGGPGATIGTIVASVLCAGCAVVVWPWRWSAAEREHHRLAAIWAQARPGTEEPTAWDRHAAWARERDGTVELLLVTRAGRGHSAPSPYTATVVETFAAEAVVAATAAMERVRADAAEREARGHERHLEAVAAAARRPYDDALRRVDDDAAAAQRRAEAEMRHELAREEAAERRAEAAAVARALRRP
jgi:hypothetical protein